MVVWTILGHFGPVHFPTVPRPRPISFVGPPNFPAKNRKTVTDELLQERRDKKRPILGPRKNQGTHIFADFCRFSLIFGSLCKIQGFGSHRFAQKTAGNRSFSQEAAENRRFLQKPVSPPNKNLHASFPRKERKKGTTINFFGPKRAILGHKKLSFLFFPALICPLSGKPPLKDKIAANVYFTPNQQNITYLQKFQTKHFANTTHVNVAYLNSCLQNKLRRSGWSIEWRRNKLLNYLK